MHSVSCSKRRPSPTRKTLSSMSLSLSLSGSTEDEESVWRYENFIIAEIATSASTKVADRIRSALSKEFRMAGI